MNPWATPAARESRTVRALLAPLLVPEGLFRAAAAARAALYSRGIIPAFHASAPVVSVGNLAVGGAGKTPVALAVASRLLARGRRVAVLSRGYGATRHDPRTVSDGRAVRLDAAEGGDEPVLLARRLPRAAVLCGPRRAELARRAVGALGADALVLDDGFQHRALARDLDVVVLDAPDAFGNGHLLPRGPNREPPSALARAGLVWLSRADAAGEPALARLRDIAVEATGRLPIESRHAPRDVLDGTLDRSLGLAALRGARALVLAAIAHPESLRRTALDLGAEAILERHFRDHHRFSDRELEEVFAAARAARCDAIVTSEKDAVRLPPAWAAREELRVVRIEAEVLAGEGVLETALSEALAAGDRRRIGTGPDLGPGRDLGRDDDPDREQPG